MLFSKPQRSFSLLTLNTFGTPIFAPSLTKRYKLIAEGLNNGPYDVVCLQEVFSYYNLSLLKKGLKNFPYLVYDKTLVGPKGGLTIFSKYPLTEPEFFAYSLPKNTTIPFYTKLAQHGYLCATVKDFSLRIATTHLSSDLEHKLTPKNRLYKLIRSQLEEAAAQMNENAKRFGQHIVVGDFNIAKHSELYTRFLDLTHAQDLFAKEESSTYHPDRFKYIYIAHNANRIDYMFMKSTKKKLSPTKIDHVFTKPLPLGKGKESYASDHIALHCILEVDK